MVFSILSWTHFEHFHLTENIIGLFFHLHDNSLNQPSTNIIIQMLLNRRADRQEITEACRILSIYHWNLITGSLSARILYQVIISRALVRTRLMIHLRWYSCNGTLCTASIQYAKSHTSDRLFRNKNCIGQNGHLICRHTDWLGSTKYKKFIIYFIVEPMHKIWSPKLAAFFTS